MIQMGQALNAPMLPWVAGGDAGWYPQQAVTHDGVAAGQSGRIGSGQQSCLSATVTGPGTLTFWWKVSSEERCDFLRFSVGGDEKAAISGETDWELKSFKVPAGSQTLRWCYETDYSVSSGLDAGCLDEVSFVSFQLSCPTWGTEGVFQFQINGAAPGNCVIHASTNLTDWMPICTNVVSGDGLPSLIEVPDTSLRWRFFRARQ
jgi:hypothetical protein